MGGSFHLDPVFAWVLRSSAEASVIAALILLTQLLLRHRLAARWRYCLWLILLVRLVMPWMPESRASVFNVVPGFPGGGSVAFIEPMSTDIAQFTGTAEVASPQDAERATPEVAGDTAPAAGTAPASRWPLSALFRTLWLAGIVCLTAHIFFENLRFWRRIRPTEPPKSTEAMALLDRCKRTMGVKRSVSLVLTDAVSSPALFGMFRPTILLPRGMAAALDKDELRYVFLHELAHLKRRDIVVNWLMTFLQALHWFNPVIWYAFHRMRTDREFACDALALSCAAPDESRAYGRTIINLLDRVYTVRRVPGMAGILEDKAQLKRRLTMIALFTKNSYRWSLLAVGILAALSATALTKASSEAGDRDAPAAATQAKNPATTMNDKVDQLDMDTAGLAEVIAIFGEPEEYRWGDEFYQRDNLPDVYCAVYPSQFMVVMNGGWVKELRFHEADPAYVFRDRIRVGSTLEEVLDVVGQPVRTVEGQRGFEDGVLYRDMEGEKGWCYYARQDQGVRFFFVDYKVGALYLTRMGPADGEPKAPAQPRRTARPRRQHEGYGAPSFTATRDVGPVEWDGDKVVSRILPYSDPDSLFTRLPIAHAAATGRGVRVAVIHVSKGNNSSARSILRAAPDAELGSRERGCKVAVIPDAHMRTPDTLVPLVEGLIDDGALVVVPSDQSEDEAVIGMVNRLHVMGVLTVGQVNRQSMLTGDRSGAPFNKHIRRIQTDVFCVGGPRGTYNSSGPEATVAGVAALVLEKWPGLTAAEVRAKIIEGAREVWQGSSIETGQWTGGNIAVDPVTTEYTPTDEESIFRFRVLDAAGALGVDTKVPWFLNMLNLPKAWEITKGAGITVAVSDQGFHIKHPELSDRIVRTAHFGPLTFDDPHQNFHGTDMSRILLSVAPEARILPILCSGSRGGDMDALGANIAESFAFAAAQGADVITASWSARFRDNGDLVAAVKQAVDSGVTASWFHFPDEYPGVIRSSFTYATWGRPEAIGFADRFLTDPPGFHPVEIEAGLSGTAPQAAGLAALAQSVNPGLTPAQVAALIVETATPVEGGVRIPDAYALVKAAQSTARALQEGRKQGAAHTPPGDSPGFRPSDIRFDGEGEIDGQGQRRFEGNVRLSLSRSSDDSKMQLRADNAQMSASTGSVELTGNVEISSLDCTLRADAGHIDGEKGVLVLSGNCRGSGEGIADFTVEEVQMDLATGEMRLKGMARLGRVGMTNDGVEVTDPVFKFKQPRDEE